MGRKSLETQLTEGMVKIICGVICIIIGATIQTIIELFSMIYNPIKRRYEKKLAVINADKEAKIAKDELLANADKFFNYEEVNQIPVDLRNELLSEIYSEWNVHGISQNLISKFGQYDNKIISRIVNREKARISLRIQAHHLFKECAQRNSLWFDIVGNDKQNATGAGVAYFDCCCEYKDLLKLNLTNELEYINANGGSEAFDILPNIMRYVRVSDNNTITLYYENKVQSLSKKEFIKYRNIKKIPLALDERDSKQLEWRELLKKKNIHFDESKIITYKFMEKTFGRKFT